MQISSGLRRALAPLVFSIVCLSPSVAHGATNALGIPCATQGDGVQFCQGSTSGPPATPKGPPTSVGSHPIPVPDGLIDANITLPAGNPPSGGWPLVIIGHGYGGAKKDLDTPEAKWMPTSRELARRGYAVLYATDRGFGESCGSPTSRFANPVACSKGWIHLMDTRFEVRDAQLIAGMLADQGLAAPLKIGAIGVSYGGGESLMLGTLKNRIMDANGKLQPWTSPMGKPMAIAAATPTIPWSDLISSLVPNGNGLDYTLPKPTDNYTPAGVLKQSFVAGLFASGAASGYYAPPMADPSADLTDWNATFNAGEPYDGNPMVPPIIDEFRLHRSALHVLDGSAAGPDAVAPAPMLISNGFTDDLFPVDETLRFYNVEKQLFPAAPVALTYFDYGHMRGQNKTADTDLLKGQINAWLDRYVLGTGSDPGQAVTALTQTCPKSAPSGGPYSAASWAAIHPGTLQYTTTSAQTLSSAAGDPSISAKLDPIGGMGDPCVSVSSADQTGTATYRLPAATGSGFTLLGAPTIVAQMAVTGQFPEIAERLFDVAPNGTETLVARGNFRPPGDTSGPQFFQLHPGAWHFNAGHVPKLELLGRDTPYVRASNGQFTIAIKALRLNLPTVETSGNGISVLPAQPAPPGSQAASGTNITTTLTTLFTPTIKPGPGGPKTPVTGPLSRKAKHPTRCGKAKKRKHTKAKKKHGKKGKQASASKSKKKHAKKKQAQGKCRKAAKKHKHKSKKHPAKKR